MIGRSAKSHRYYYYSCNRSNKQGKDGCNSRAFPKEKLEREVIDRIKEKVLTQECLEEINSQERKAFLRSFVKHIVINGDKATIHYNLPMPPDGKRKQKIEVLPIDTPGGDRGIRTPNLCDANAALSLLSYIPISTAGIITYIFLVSQQYYCYTKWVTKGEIGHEL